MPEILVLGVGNMLMRDDGVGVEAVQRLGARYRLPPEVEALDGGTVGLDLLPRLNGVSSLLLLDAVRTGEPPGTLVRLAGDAIPGALALKVSVHELGLEELLDTSRLSGTTPERIVLLGIVPAVVDWGVGLTPEIAEGVDDLVKAAVAELRGWGVRVDPVP